ncbi:PleD family two-component system response regulator [Novosphingobium sp. FKTRR1]|uniref:response regulator n=1 Tax=Novosphingobium sp. FKTRR1 TaxID=2879118 RepID=UPI001CF075A0|nr:response regulator [Novosphingobium sp. FKTRR1]
MTRILVVDDAQTQRLYYRDVLGRAGYGVDEAIDGIEGLEKALVDPYDLYIIDINMRGMDGLSMLRTLRQEDMPQGAVMIVSNETGANVGDAAVSLGANLFSPKPVRGDLLLAQVRALVGATRPPERALRP